MRVLVTDGEQRSALAVTRSLGRAGYETFVCGPAPHALAGVSRFCRAYAEVPYPLANPGGFASRVAGLARDWRVDVLLPMTDQSQSAILSRRGEFGEIRIPGPDYETFRRASDKAALLSVASGLQISVPFQEIIRQPDEGVRALSANVTYPVALKPYRSMADGQKFGVAYAAGPAELENHLKAFPHAAYPLLIQRRIQGPGVGVFLLLWNGTVLARFAHRRLREYPPSGGASTYCESIAMDEALFDQSVALLTALNWQGVAMVEYKQDLASGRYYLMEVNGRFWGSLQLAIDAGVDFPTLLVKAAQNEPPAAVLTYRTNVRLRSWWRDVDHLVSRLWGSGRVTDGSAERITRLAIVREFVRRRPPERLEALRIDDPWPFAVDTLDWVRGKAHRLWRGR